MSFLSEPAPSFDAPMAMLVACHDKVRRFAALCLRVDQHLSEFGIDEEARVAAANILRYFNLAAPLHHADEEEDLFPALRSLGDAALNARIAALEAEHVQLDVLWRAVRPWLEAIAEHGSPVRPRELAAFVARYTEHANQEEQALYPSAGRLSAEQLNNIGRNMRARRTDAA